MRGKGQGCLCRGRAVYLLRSFAGVAAPRSPRDLAEALCCSSKCALHTSSWPTIGNRRTDGKRTNSGALRSSLGVQQTRGKRRRTQLSRGEWESERDSVRERECERDGRAPASTAAGTGAGSGCLKLRGGLHFFAAEWRMHLRRVDVSRLQVCKNRSITKLNIVHCGRLVIGYCVWWTIYRNVKNNIEKKKPPWFPNITTTVWKNIEFRRFKLYLYGGTSITRIDRGRKKYSSYRIYIVFYNTSQRLNFIILCIHLYQNYQKKYFYK